MAKNTKSAKKSYKRPKKSAMGRAKKLVAIVTKPIYLAVLIVAAIIYYYVFYYLITSSNYGLFLLTVPIYLLYTLVITSALLLTIAVSSIHGGIKYGRAITGSVSGSIILLAGGTIASCACTVPIFVSLLYIVGATVADVTLINFYISTYQLYLFSALILANLALIYHYLGRL